jgi:hypothetical protein
VFVLRLDQSLRQTAALSPVLGITRRTSTYPDDKSQENRLALQNRNGMGGTPWRLLSYAG